MAMSMGASSLRRTKKISSYVSLMRKSHASPEALGSLSEPMLNRKGPSVDDAAN
jgi:hypothetical protein